MSFTGFPEQYVHMCWPSSGPRSVIYAYNLSQQKRLCHPTAKHRSCIVQILALDDIRNEIIGDEEVRGISGGQRKRVNVGLELVADPIMLFLDEPTSGLDSTSSKMVISALQQVCACK